MKRIFEAIWGFLEVLIIIYVILITTTIIFRNDYGYSELDKYTLSNINEVDSKYIKDSKPGNLLIVKKTNDIEVGDYIYYYAVIKEKYYIRTGIVTKVTKDDYNSLYDIDTKITGDKQEKFSVSSSRVLGKYASQKEKLGSILTFLQTRLGFLIFVLIPIMIVFLYQLYEFIIVYKYERYEELENKLKQINQKDTKDDIEIL